MSPVFRSVADRAVLVEFAEAASPLAEAAVRALDRALATTPCPGLVEAVPAIVNLLVVFDPVLSDHGAVTAHLRDLLAHPAPQPGPATLREVAVRYDGRDLEAVAQQTGLSVADVIAAHQAAEFHVVMYGFAPGYAYLGGLPEALRLPRKPAALRNVPAGSVIIAGGQCLVTTLTMPTGWWIIGHSPTPILTGDPGRPFLFDPGDRVRFTRLTDG